MRGDAFPDFLRERVPSSRLGLDAFGPNAQSRRQDAEDIIPGPGRSFGPVARAVSGEPWENEDG